MFGFHPVPSTILGLPRLTEDLSELTHVVVGVPYDGGTMTNPGARHGAEIARSMSGSLPELPGEFVDPVTGHRLFVRLTAADAGDIVPLSLHPGSTRSVVYRRIEEAVTSLTSAGLVPVLIGGDHSVTAPAVSAVGEFNGPVDLVVLDAHVDSAGVGLRGYAEMTHATFLDVASVREVACTTTVLGVRELVPAAVFELHPRINVRGVDSLLAPLGARPGIPTYLSIDLDVLDPADFPSTGHPIPGGIRFRELETVVRRIARERDVLAVDIVEAMPGDDQHTGLIISRLVEVLLAFSQIKKNT
jgi:agmatinase